MPGAESMQVFVGAKEPSEGHEAADDKEEGGKDGEDLVGGVSMAQIGQVAEVVSSSLVTAPSEVADG